MNILGSEEKLIPFSEGIKSALQSMLKEIKPESKQALFVLTKYVSVIHPHFIVWLSGMQNSCVSEVGKSAAADNIRAEILENHQKMLLNFMDQLNIRPDADEYEKFASPIEQINNIIHFGLKNKNGTGPAAIIYFLEEASKVFIPWMKKVAVKHQATDLRYIKLHGKADEEHAQCAFYAVIEEEKINPEFTDQIILASLACGLLIDQIFR